MSLFFFFNDTATTEIYTLSLHDALPISQVGPRRRQRQVHPRGVAPPALLLVHHESPFRRDRDTAVLERPVRDRKSTRLNSSHSQISYAVFCLKKKNKHLTDNPYHTSNQL